PSREQIAEALSGQICRCTGYLQIFDAVAAAARALRGERAPAPQLPGVREARETHGAPETRDAGEEQRGAVDGEQA
ncbi:MAG TPA: 2Fe-2S iron-sulfur cluster-binding protein, partial [Kofleriaceae bacterium]|nr:2Fe-2S iron-sulfur cluster-binding protein [Kofleriaceae bacterium]